MPTTEQILAGLQLITNTWWPLAVFWHIYFAVIIIALMFSVRFTKRVGGILLSLPILSVSFVAWMSSNPFNSILYALIGILLIYFSVKLPREKISIAPLWILIPGIIMFIFGWVYPHFLEYSSSFAYLYAAPTGLIPCPTLSIVIGLLLIVNGLEARAAMLLIGIVGLYYGITGVVQLKVLIDLVLLLGAAVVVVAAFAIKRKVKPIEA